MKSFSKKEALGFGWSQMKSHFWLFVGILIFSLFIQYLPQFVISGINQSSKEKISLAAATIYLVMLIFKLIIDLGTLGISLKINDNQPASFKDLFAYWKFLGKYLLGVLLCVLIVAAGLILLIIPGIILAIRFQYFSYFIVDKNLGPIEALKHSWRITKGNTFNLFLFGLLTGLINIAGAFCLVVGLLATVPMAMVAQAYVYRKLQSGSEGVAAPIPGFTPQPAPQAPTTPPVSLA